MASGSPVSPRLPSPPPTAEIQLGPKSPSVGPANRQVQVEQQQLDANAKRRIHAGTKAADMAAGPPLVPLSELDSAFQLQEHLAALYYHHTACSTVAITRQTAHTLATPPPGTDRTLWLYELCRFLIARCNDLVVGFLFDAPPCSAATCPEMRASEWQFLCAVHEQPKSCCAIDYCCHTLDWAANVVTNPKVFPSRFVVDVHDKSAALKNLVNVFRRLHRIFAHAWFQHRGVFWAVEGATGLYMLFKTVCDAYDLLPAENHKLPPEAEGLDGDSSKDRRADEAGDDEKTQQPFKPTYSIAKNPAQQWGGSGKIDVSLDEESFSPVGRTNTRRHIRSSPSTGCSVTTVLKAAEENGLVAMASQLREMRISAPPETVEEEPESEDVPVMVDSAAVHSHMNYPQQAPPLRPPSVMPQPQAPASVPIEDAATAEESSDKTGTMYALETRHDPSLAVEDTETTAPVTEAASLDGISDKPRPSAVTSPEPAAADNNKTSLAEAVAEDKFKTRQEDGKQEGKHPTKEPQSG